MFKEDQIRAVLATVKYPGFSRDIVSFGLVKSIQISDNGVTVEIAIATRDPNIPRLIHQKATEALQELDGIGEVQLNFDISEPANTPNPQNPAALATQIPGVKKIIAVASGKGGVGKSTVSANLALALAATGARVGLCDCDLYGPSVAHMFGTDESPSATADNRIIPIEKHGLQLMSMGFLLDDNSPVIVRGPIATRYTQQFLRQCAWDNLDYLILDLPPGTGDIQLTIVQTIALSGVVIVTTPQEIALIDARKAVSMFQKVNVPILGVIENMSYFVCPSDGEIYHIFGKNGGEREAKRLGVPLIAQIPLEMQVREGGDSGSPVALQPPHENLSSQAFHRAAIQVQALVQSA